MIARAVEAGVQCSDALESDRAAAQLCLRGAGGWGRLGAGDKGSRGVRIMQHTSQRRVPTYPLSHPQCKDPFLLLLAASRAARLQVEKLSHAAQAIVGRYTDWAAKEAATDARVRARVDKQGAVTERTSCVGRGHRMHTAFDYQLCTTVLGGFPAEFVG